METGMKKVFDSMENALRLQFQVNAERRAAKAEQEEKDFRERLMQAASKSLMQKRPMPKAHRMPCAGISLWRL